METRLSGVVLRNVLAAYAVTSIFNEIISIKNYEMKASRPGSGNQNFCHFPELQSKDNSKAYNAKISGEKIAELKEAYIPTEDLSTEKNINIHRIKVKSLCATSDPATVVSQALLKNRNFLPPNTGPLQELHLDFSRCQPSKNQYRGMFDVLLANSHALKKFSFRLDFDGQNTYFPGAASDREIKVISGAVKNLDKLEDLEIDFINTAHHFAGDGALRCLMSSFKKMLNIRHLSLNIEHNSFDDDQFEALFFRISDFKKIKNLELNVSRSIWLSDFSIVTAHLEKMTGLEALKITARAVNGEPEDFPEMLDSLTHLTEASFRLPFFDPHHADPQRRTRNADVEQKLSVIRDRRLKKELREREETFKQAVVARPRQKRRLGG